jgi:hypothetical protein
MKIVTKAVFQMTKDGMDLLEEDSYEYDGPISHCGGKGGGGGGDQTITTINEPWGPQQPYLKEIFGEAQNIYNQNPSQFYPGQTYSPLNPLQQLGAQEHLAYGTSPQLQGLIGGTQEAYKSMINAPDIMNNPYVQNLTDVTAGRIGEQLREQVMPSIRAGAIGRGQSGSSRHGIAEALAAKSGQQAIADATAQQLSGAYGQGLTQQARGMAFTPQTMGLGFGPAAAITSVGDKYRGETQKALQEDILRWQFAKEAPWEDLGKYQQFIQGQYGGEGTQTSSGGGSGGGFNLAGAIGGGLTGLGLSGISPGAIGFAGSQGGMAGLGSLAAANPWGAAAIGGLALMGGLF